MTNEKLSKLDTLSGLEKAYKYIYENNLSLQGLDCEMEVFKDFFREDEPYYSLPAMVSIFKEMIRATAESEYLPTEFLIPHGKKMYVQKWPHYMPNALFYHKDALEIHYVLKGTVSHTVDGTDFDLEEGDMCFIAPDTTYSLSILDESTVMLSIIAYTDVLSDIIKNIPLNNDILSEFFSKTLYGHYYLPFLLCKIGVDRYIRGQIIDMLEVQDTAGPYTDRYMSLSLEMLCLRLLQNHRSHIISGSNVIKNAPGITVIMDYAQANYATITLAELAKKFNYSYSYLSLLIKEHYGCSFNSMLQDIRLERAAFFLNNSDRSILDIVEAVGYTDKSYFYKIFKKKFGKTPEAFRRENHSV